MKPTTLLLICAALLVVLAVCSAAEKRMAPGVFVTPNAKERRTANLVVWRIYDHAPITWSGFDSDDTIIIRLTDHAGHVLEKRDVPNTGSYELPVSKVLPGNEIELTLTGTQSGVVGRSYVNILMPAVFASKH
jgi:hypothetical protein